MDKKGSEQQVLVNRTVIIVHARFGQKSFMYSPAHTLTELRTSFEEKCELYLFSNYYFEYKGKRIPEYEPLQDHIEDKCKIDVCLTAFDYRAAKHHLSRVMEIIYDPELFLYLTSSEQDLPENQLQNTFTETIPSWVTSPYSSIVKPDLNSQILSNPTQWQRKLELLQSLSLSGFNPPPSSQKLNGDLFYIHARSLQGQDIHITASVNGFFINQSKISWFNPHRISTNKNTYLNLIDLFKAVSEKFRTLLDTFLAQNRLTQTMKFKFFSLGKIRKRKWFDSVETEHGWHNRKVVLDSHVKNQLNSLKDWNQSFQAESEIGQQNEISEIEKKAQLSKLYAEFVEAAIEGACYLIDGKIPPLNPTDDKKKHIYIFNKIFFSIANQTVYDHSQEKGEDATPSSSSVNSDLINIQILNNLNVPSLHVLHMVVVNYRGFKVIAQCIIPGILSVDQMNCSQYGSIDDGTTIETNPEFEKLMIQVCEKLGLEEKITVIDGSGVRKVIAGSPDIKGILGSDKRKYILDLLRISPRDLNYQGTLHETCVIRRELLHNFYKNKKTTQGVQKLPKLNVNIGTDLKFEKDQNFQKQENLLKDIASYLRLTAIPNLIEHFKTNPSHSLTDNKGISRAFHSFGINMRYLGQVHSHPSLKEEINIQIALQKVIGVRCMKHLLRIAMRESNIMHLGATIVNVLNCLFGKKCHLMFLEEGAHKSEMDSEQNYEKQQKKKKKKKVNKEAMNQIPENQISMFINVIKIAPNRFLHMRPSEIWSQTAKIAKARYQYQLPVSHQYAPFTYPFMKISILRDLCLSIGLVLEKKNYDIVEGTGEKTLPFVIKNIAGLTAIPKHMSVAPPNLRQRQKQSQGLIQKLHVKDALHQDSGLQRENLFISGGVNETAIKLYSRMGKILYILGENKSAISQQEKNLVMLQSLSSQDFYLNIQSHLNLGMYYLNAINRERAQYHYLKAAYLMLICYGETAPDLLICLTNLARIQQQNKNFKQSIECYESARRIFESIHGKYHVKISICLSSLASISFQVGDIKKAIEYQTQNVATLNKILVDSDARLQDAMKILRYYREIYQNKESVEKNIQWQQLQMQQQQQEQKKKKGKKNI